jgi:predicted TIM-barrel fold metal-dependent hydrolase
MIRKGRLKRRALLAASAAALAPWREVAAQRAESVLRIDCQSHLFCPDLLAIMEKRKLDPTVFVKDGVRYLKMGDWLRKGPPLYTDVGAKLAAMDAAGIGMTALSINDPGPEWFGEDGARVARVANDFVAGVVASHPSRFFGLGVLPWQDMKAVLAEADRCVKELGMRGFLVYTNLAGRFPDEEGFRPFFRRAVELNVPVLLHPAKPLTTEVVKGYEMTSTLGNMFDNTIALTRLIMSGLLDELPELKLVCPHLGGTLPYIVGRLDHQVKVLKRGPQSLKKAPQEYLRQIWMDVVSPLPLAIQMCRQMAGADRLLYASDHPWVDPGVIVQAVEEANLSGEEKRGIYRDNAVKLFRL